MRILVIGPSLFLPWVDYTTAALRRMGHTVEVRHCTNILLDRLTLRKGKEWTAGVPGLPGALEKLRAGWHERRDRALLKTAAEFKPELVLLMHGESLSAAFLQALKKQVRCPVVAWWVDNPFRHPIRELFPPYDSTFIFDRSYIPALKEAGAPRVEFLPCCADETVYRPVELTPGQRRRYASDIAMVAWRYDRRVEVARALDGLDLKIWGVGWKRDSLRAEERFVPDEEAALIYGACKIGLNVHAEQTKVAGPNTRSFELLAAGAFQLTDRVEGMEELLEPGKEVAVYGSPQEAREMAEHYLARPEERAAMAARGRERVLREHTYAHRMKTLMEKSPK